MPRLPRLTRLSRPLCLLAGIVGCAFAAPSPASANDTTAYLGAGGLAFARNESVEMRSEDLFVSEAEIRVRYVFHNKAAKDITTLVAFPMPDIAYHRQGQSVEIPFPERANFLDFRTVVDGKPVTAEMERRVFSFGIDRTRLLEEMKLPLMPVGEATEKALAALPAAKRDELFSLGLAAVERIDTGKGMEDDFYPGNWTLRTTYYWTQTFPAGKDLVVEHRYKPSVGTTAGTRLGSEPKEREDIERRREVTQKYCLDRDILAAVARGKNMFYEHRISYVLVTGANWAGPIADFTLTVDKGAPENLVSFCGSGVRKIGPTTFQVKRKDLWTDVDLDVLILQPIR